MQSYSKLPTFGKKDSEICVYCSEYAKEGMMNVVKKGCAQHGSSNHSASPWKGAKYAYAAKDTPRRGYWTLIVSGTTRRIAKQC